MDSTLRRRRLVDAALVALAALLVHAPALHATAFTYDDVPIVAENPRLVLDGPGDLWALVRSDYWGDPVGKERLWRPLALVTFALERSVHGGDPDLYRLGNVLLHALAAALGYLLFASVLRRRRGALLGALWFALHPVHAEVTGGVVGRSELLALALALGGIHLHLRGRRRRRPLAYVGAGALFFLAFTAKEIALTAPFLLVLIARLARDGGPSRGRLRAAAPYLLYALAVGGYFLVRHAVLDDTFARPGGRTLGAMAAPQRLLVAGWAYLDSLLSLGLPHRTAAHYPLLGTYAGPLAGWLGVASPPGVYPPEAPGWSSPLAAAPLLLHAALLGAGAWALGRRRPRWARAAGLGVWGLYLALGPVSNLIVPIGVVRADRLLYTPSLFACLAAGALASGALARRPRALALVAALTLLPGALLLQHNVRSWTDSERLWRRTLAVHPEEARAHLALGGILLGQGRAAEAVPFLDSAAAGFGPEGSPRLAAKSRALLAAALRGVRPARLDLAEALLVEARQIDPTSVEAVRGLTQLYLVRAERDEAARRRWLQQAVRTARSGTRHAHGDYSLWILLGTAYQRLEGREPEAEAAYARAIERHPAPWQAHLNRAELRAAGGDRVGALRDFRAAGELLRRTAPDSPFAAVAARRRAELALALGRREEALAELRWLRARVGPADAEQVEALLREARRAE